MQDFKSLKVWQKSHDLTISMYKATILFPKEEKYGLTSQMRRASYSVPSNIAEGCGRLSKLEFLHFLQIAIGSTSELEYFIILSKDLNYLKSDMADILTIELHNIRKMLTKLILSIKVAQ